MWYHMTHELKYPIGDFHRELIRSITNPRIAIAAPRGFAKSYYFSYFYPLFAALERPGTNIVLISATGALSEYWLARIKRQLEVNNSLRQFYGDQVGSKWTNECIELKNGSCIMAKGAGKQIRGFRPDIVIGDDLETDEMVISVEQRKKFDHWFWSELMGMLLNHGQVVVVGTILHPESFLSEMLKQGRHGWVSRLYQAIKPDETALWPDQWPLSVLHNRRAEMGTYAFNQEFMNDPIPDDLRIFQERWLNYFVEEPQGCTYFTTIDPAITIGDTSDCTAIVTCAVDQAANLYVVDVVNKRLLPNEIVDQIFATYRKWKPAVVGIEIEGFQKVLKYDLDKERIRRREYPRIVELKSGGRRKGLRIEGLQPLFESGKILLRPEQHELKTQLLRFPSPRCKDDIIDALAYMLDIIYPAKHEVKRINPDSFAAEMARRRKHKLGSDDGVWGNHSLRSL